MIKKFEQTNERSTFLMHLYYLLYCVLVTFLIKVLSFVTILKLWVMFDHLFLITCEFRIISNRDGLHIIQI
jgi:hypothetical protein